MTTDQIILFTLFGAVFGLLLWGRFRYDLVAFAALMTGVVLGVVPEKDAFSGFGHRGAGAGGVGGAGAVGRSYVDHPHAD